jgi:hypothetical protein
MVYRRQGAYPSVLVISTGVANHGFSESGTLFCKAERNVENRADQGQGLAANPVDT